MRNKKRKVFVGLSGGVDSAVAAALLKDRGYEVTGVFMRQFDTDIEESIVCTQRLDRKDALAVASTLSIPFEEWDFRDEYKKWVIDYMTSEYAVGRTPNPDVMCNKHVKFGRFLEEALARGADFVATGHYVKKTQNPKKVCKLLQAKDSNKDQSYFLYTLTQEQLVHCIFPLGNFIKPEVRKMAASYGLPNFAKKDSQGVCFLGEIAMADFLKHRIDLKPGKLMTLEGIVVGEHQGAGYYTIGQRHGLGSKGGSDPLYVVDKDMVKNIVYVAPGDDNPALFQKKLRCANIHWISGSAPTLPLDCCVRIRYRQPLQSCTVMTGKKRYLQVVFVKSQRAITPGQIVVFYRNKEMLGGGVIV